LHFDLNGNGDLTDDPVIEALAPGNVRYPPGYASFSFPRVDLTVDVDGTGIEYAFFFSGTSRLLSFSEKQQYQYVYASLNAAVYREGEITVDGQKLRVVVTDFNSNGRFDDLAAPDPNVSYGDGSVYLRPGDMIFVDPQPQDAPSYDVTMSDAQHYLAKTIPINGRFYDLQITPAGDKLTVKPSTREVGHVSNPHHGYRGLVYGDLGVLKITSDAEGRASCPRVRGSCIRIPSTGRDTNRPTSKPDAAPSLLQTLAGALLGAQPTAAQVHQGFGPNDRRTHRFEVQPGNRRSAVRAALHAQGDGFLPARRPALTGLVAGRCGRRNVQQPGRQRSATGQAGVHHHRSGREGGPDRHLRVWVRLHLPVLVASTLGTCERIPRESKMEGGPFKIDPDYESVLKAGGLETPRCYVRWCAGALRQTFRFSRSARVSDPAELLDRRSPFRGEPSKGPETRAQPAKRQAIEHHNNLIFHLSIPIPVGPLSQGD
jgi:hypothetical protein